jgi:hypothetical protein
MPSPDRHFANAAIFTQSTGVTPNSGDAALYIKTDNKLYIKNSSGTESSAGVDLASPSAIGSTTPNAGTFTTLVANTSLNASNIFGVGSTNGGVAIRATSTNVNLVELIGFTIFCINNGNITAAINRASSKTIATTLDGNFAWGPSTTSASGGDANATKLFSDSVNIIAQRNSTNAQAFRLYNTFTSDTNFERLNFRWASNEFILDAEKGSAGGTLRGIKIGSATSSLLGFYGVTPVDQPATVTDPTGGGTQDAEARTAINAIIDRLQELGLIG